MDGIVPRVAGVWQELLGPVSEQAARDVGFVRRKRKITGESFVRTLVLTWLACGTATVADLAAELGVRTSALQQRLTWAAVRCLERVFAESWRFAFQEKVTRIPLLNKFAEVCVEDCTTVSLPPCLAMQFPGCGNGQGEPDTGRAALKLFTSYNIRTGKVKQVAPAAGRASDVKIAREHAQRLPKGSLRMRDMGFFDRELFRRDQKDGVFWLSRVPAGVTLRTSEDGPQQKLAEYLLSLPRDTVACDRIVWIGRDNSGRGSLACRLLAIRCPEEVAAQRRQKVHETACRKGRTASAAQLALCDWTVFATNLPCESFSPEEIVALYRSRWQIELLFKRWKSQLHLKVSADHKGERALCELWAKLIGSQLSGWLLRLRGGPLEGYNQTQALRRIKRAAGTLIEVWNSLTRIIETFEKLLKALNKLPLIKRSSTRASLIDPKGYG